MNNNNKNRAFLLRLAVLSVFILFLVLFYNVLIYLGFNFLDKTTVSGFFLKSRILYIITGALIGGVLIYSVKIKARFRALLMGTSFILFGILPALGDTHCFYQISSSLCALIKPLLFVSQGIYNIPIKYFILFTSIIALSLLGKNLFCGWICPVGALQEAAHFASPGIKKKRISFTVSNAVRAVVFLSSIILLFATGINLYYDYLNPFIAASLKLSIMSWFLTSFFFLLAIIAASLFYYRPYCYLICPIGLITWVSTFFSLYRVSCDQTKCTRCMKCVEETVCPAVKPIIEGKTVVPDCFHCGQCIDKCPENALSFTVK